MSTLNRKRRILVVVGFALIGCMGLGIIFRVLLQPDLEWYVTAPLDKAGHRGRVLVPRGWETNMNGPTILTNTVKSGEVVTIAFNSRPSPLSQWLRGILRQPTDREFLCIQFAPKVELFGLNPNCPADGTINLESPNWFMDAFAGFRVIATGKPALFGDVTFLSYDKRTFDRLHSVVCKSFEILPGK